MTPVKKSRAPANFSRYFEDFLTNAVYQLVSNSHSPVRHSLNVGNILTENIKVRGFTTKTLNLNKDKSCKNLQSK